MSNVSVQAPERLHISNLFDRYLLPLAGVGAGAFFASLIFAALSLHYVMEYDTTALLSQNSTLTVAVLLVIVGLPALGAVIGVSRSADTLNPNKSPGRFLLAHILAGLAFTYLLTIILYLLNASGGLQVIVWFSGLLIGMIWGLMRLPSETREEWTTGFAFITPPILVLTVFIVIPMLFALYVSLRDWDGFKPVTESSYIGFDNYQRLLFQDGIKQKNFFLALRNTVYYTLGVVPMQTVIALVLASIANQQWLKGRNFFRTAFYFPSITSSVVVAIIFLWLFQNQGIVNKLLSVLPGYQPVQWLGNSDGILRNLYELLGFNLREASEPVQNFLRTEIAGLSIWDWIAGPSVTLTAIMILNIWTTIGTMMLIFLAALQNIPGQLYEAASVDGATRLQQFRKITVPMLRPTIFFVVTIGLIGCLQVFDQIYVIGGDRTTTSIAYRVYQTGFDDADMSLATATAFVLFVIIFIFTLIQRRFTAETADV